MAARKKRLLIFFMSPVTIRVEKLFSGLLLGAELPADLGSTLRPERSACLCRCNRSWDHWIWVRESLLRCSEYFPAAAAACPCRCEPSGPRNWWPHCSGAGSVPGIDHYGLIEILQPQAGLKPPSGGSSLFLRQRSPSLQSCFPDMRSHDARPRRHSIPRSLEGWSCPQEEILPRRRPASLHGC